MAQTLSGLRHGVIHNDANDHNILVADSGDSISGVLDLGDALWSVTVNELAVAAAYAALDAPDPLATIAAVRDGFEQVLPLAEDERDVLLELIALRLYLTVSEAPAWKLLARLAAAEPTR